MVDRANLRSDGIVRLEKTKTQHVCMENSFQSFPFSYQQKHRVINTIIKLINLLKYYYPILFHTIRWSIIHSLFQTRCL